MLISLDICDLFNGVMLNGGGRVGGKLATKCFFFYENVFFGGIQISSKYILSALIPQVYHSRGVVSNPGTK